MDTSDAPSRRPYAPRLPGHERREQLLDAALSLVSSRGYDTITVAAIAREAGVTRPVIYAQFATLEELLEELLERQTQRALSQLARAMPIDPGNHSPEEVTLTALKAFLAAVQEEPETWRAILFPPRSTPPELRRRMASTRMQISTAFQEVVSWGFKKRGMVEGADVELFTMTLMGLFEQAGRLILENPAAFPPARISRFAQGLLISSPSAAPADSESPLQGSGRFA